MERWTKCVLPGPGGSRRRGQAATGLLMNIARRRYGGWKRSSGNFRISSFACEWRRTRRSSISSWRSVARVPSRHYNPRTRFKVAGPPLSHHDHHLWPRLRRLGAPPLPWGPHCPDRRACDSARHCARHPGHRRALRSGCADRALSRRRRHHHHGALAVHRARGVPARRAGPRHRAYARQRSARRCVRRSATGRRRLRRVVAREPAKRAAVTGVAGPRALAVSRVVGRRIAMSIVSLLLNLLWIVFGGLWMALAWVIAAVVMAITIVGLPWARAAFSIAAYTLLPFGYKTVPRDEYFGREDVGSGPLGVIGNIVWLLLAGWWLALGHLVTAMLLALTIVGIPFAWAHLKLAGLALWPIGKAIVPVQNV